MKAPAAPAQEPLVTVVMPVRDEARHLGAVLAALLDGDYPASRTEVLVVDGGSVDGTREMVRAVAAVDGRVRLLDNPARSAPAGLNVGIRSARGQIIVRLDGHAYPASDYLRACVSALGRSGAWAVGGPMVPFGTTIFGCAAALAARQPFGAGDARFRLGGRGPADTVYLGAWRREVFEQVGLFDEDLRRNQDAEMCARIRRNGGVVWLDPAIRTQTASRESPRTLARQYFGYGMGRAATVARHPASLQARQAIPAAFVGTLLLAGALVPVSAAARRLLGVVVVAYGVADLAASALAARYAGRPPAAPPFARAQAGSPAAGRRRASAARACPCRPSSVVWRLPLAFATMHLAWGSGFWIGLALEALGRVRVRRAEGERRP